MKPIRSSVAVPRLGLAACQKPKQVKPDETAAATTTDAASTSGIGDAGTAAARPPSPLTPQEQALADLAQRASLYFDFDSSEIRPSTCRSSRRTPGYLVKFPSARACGSRATPTSVARASTTSASASARGRPCAAP